MEPGHRWRKSNRLEWRKPLHEKADQSPGSAPVKRSLSPDGDWPSDVPRPPKPVEEPEGKKRLKDEGWMEPVPTAVVELLSMSAYLKANKGKLDPEHWYEYIGPISDQLAKDLMAEHEKVACVHLEQVKNHDPLEIQLNAGWKAEDIMAYVPSILGMDFTSLGTNWMLTYRGAHVNLVQQWLHFGVVFSPGLTSEGAPLGRAVGLEALPNDVQKLAKIKGVIPLRRTTVDALARIGNSKVSSGDVTLSHGAAALMEDATAPKADEHHTVVGAAAATVHHGSQQTAFAAEYHDDIAEDLLEAAVRAEKVLADQEKALEIEKKEGNLGGSGPSGLADGDKERSNEQVPDAAATADGEKVKPENESTGEFIGEKSEIEKVGADSAADGGRDKVAESPAKDDMSATLAFSVQPSTDDSELFHQAPPQTGFSVVRSGEAWARPPREGYKGARIFVDGHVLRVGESVSSGILGPVGFDFMCVSCGAVSHVCETLWGYPFCETCKGSCCSAAQARKLWRTQAAFTSPLEGGVCFGTGERKGYQGNDPRVIVSRVEKEFQVVPVDTCAVRMNVLLSVKRVDQFFGRVCFHATSVGSSAEAIVVLDEWFQHHWIPTSGDVLWISGLTTWGVLNGTTIQFLFPPATGVGIAKQPVLAGRTKPTRALELFAGIGGWGDACENVLGVEEFYSVDIDPLPCKLLALKRRVVPYTVDQLVEEVVEDRSAVVVGDVADPRWWFTSCVVDPFDVIAWSSPCITFSKAGMRAGLLSPEGLVLLKAIGLRSVFGSFFSFGENVLGLLKHEHWPLILDFAKGFGQFGWIELNLSVIAPMQRPRLFVVQYGMECDVFPSHDVRNFANLALQELYIQPSLIDPVEAAMLRVSREVLKFLADPAMAVGQRVVHTKDRELYGYGVAERTYQWPGDVLPVLMANHGRQHLLPKKLLHQNGLMAWVLADKRLGHGVQSLRAMHPFEALWLLGFDVFGPISASKEDMMKPVGNTVSPWVAGAFLAAVYAANGEHKFLVRIRKWLQWSVEKDRLLGMKVFTRGDCLWLAAVCPPLPPSGTTSWILHWGHAFFLFRADIDSIDARFVQSLCGFDSNWKCHTVITPADPSQFCLPLVSIVGDSAELTVQLSGTFKADPGDCIGSLYQRADLSPSFHVLTIEGRQPSRNAQIWTVVDSTLKGTLELQGPAPKEVCETRLIFRNEVHAVKSRDDMTIAEAIRVALPFPCHAEGAEVWDVVTRCSVPTATTLPSQGGIYQVFLVPELFAIEPIGLIIFPPMSTVGECLTVLNDALYGSKASVLLTGNGRTVDQEIPIGAAATRGVLRLKVYGLRGGGKPTLSPLDISNKLQELLVEKGVPKAAADERTHEVYKGLGTKTLKQIFSHKDPWQALKQEATKEKIVLIGALERQQKENVTASSAKQVEEPFDAWQAWLDNRSMLKQAKAKRREAVEETAFQLDSSFFKDSQGSKIPSATPEELLGGAAGIAVCQLNEISSLLPSFCSKNVTVEASAVVIIGGEAAALGPRFRDLIVPGWMNGKTVALKVAVLSTGDEPIQWDEAQKVTVDVVNGNTVCLCFVYPAEAGDKWAVLQQGFDRYFKKIFPTAPEALVDHWAQAYYCKKRKVEPDQAEYFHIIVRINDKYLESVLKVCGRNGLYLQPRSPTRSLDTRFGVVRLTGLAREEALAMQQQVPFQLGLVRTTKGFGLRVRSERVREARKVVFPEVEVSSESGDDGQHRYRLLGVPEVFDRRAVKTLVGKLGWRAKVGKAVGWKTWLVSSESAPPTKTIQVGDTTVVVAEETLVVKQEVVVAATESKLKGLRADKARVMPAASAERPLIGELGGQHTDKIRQVKEQVREEIQQDLETACNQRIAVLETAVEELKSSSVYQQNQTAAVQRELGAVQQQVAGLPDQISALCKQLQQDSDGKLKELATEFSVSLRERDNKIGSQFEEIKAMFEGATSAKSRKVADGL